MRCFFEILYDRCVVIGRRHELCLFVYINQISHHGYQRMLLLDRQSNINYSHHFEFEPYCIDADVSDKDTWAIVDVEGRPSVLMVSTISMIDLTSFSETTDASIKYLIIEWSLATRIHLERSEWKRYSSLSISIDIWTNPVGNWYLSPFTSRWDIWLAFSAFISDSIVRSLCR